ncbi:transcription factor 24-like [Lytechinus variegatus]|uniref:transcription factor 24-like n=1 Tax=Lytechinus variegatus TaxID=7654 RepID=UPI001BB12800|nr:transcription factor 24-like [Lytechinus variegatus]
MSEQTGAENLSFLDNLVLEPPSLNLDKLEEISPVLAELTVKPKTANAKPTRRGRKRNADKITGATQTGDGTASAVKSGSTTDGASAVKPKRGRGRPAGSTNRTSNKLSTPAAAAPPAPTTKADDVAENDPVNAARERSRVKTLRDAFLELQRSLPSVPPDTKLSKLDVLVLATTYISHLMRTLDDDQHSTPISPGDDVAGGGGGLDKHHRLKAQGYLHPVKKWPMRSRLYAGASGDCLLDGSS